MRSIKRRLGVVGMALLAPVLVVVVLLPAVVLAYPYSPSDTEVDTALDFLRDAQTGDGDIGGFEVSAWVVMAIAAAGEDPADWPMGSNPSIVDYLAAHADEATSASDYARLIQAVVAAGEDPSDFAGVDFVDLLLGEYSGGQIGDPSLVSDDFWGVVALIAAGESAASDIVEDSVAFIKDCQQSDGGWGYDVAASWGTDVDDTAAAIMALVAAGESPAGSGAVADGLLYIKSQQTDSGGFGFMGASNPGTDSWAIDAIVAAGQNPTSAGWTKNGFTPVDDLESFQNPDGSFDDYLGDPDPWMTAYAIPAFLGEPYPVAVQDTEPEYEPEIGFDPEDFSFSATEDGEDPLDRTLEIWNSEDGTLDWSVESDEDWLSLHPTSGSSTGETDDVTVSVDVSGMNEGEYDATITIEAPYADNSPRTVDVSLELGEAVDEPTIAYNPSDFSFAAEEGGGDPPDQMLEIWNSGTDEISWSVESDEDWLELDPAEGDSDGEHDGVTLSVDVSDLDAGDYEATITIDAPEADNSPEIITVELEIEGNVGEDEPTIDFSPSSLAFIADEGGGDPQGKTLRIWNSGDGTLDWSVSADADWLSLDPDEGKSTGEKDNVSVSVDISGLDEGEYDVEITIRDPDASKKTEKVEVTLEVGGGSDLGLYSLTTSASPLNGGIIALSVPQPAGGYADGTAVQLTAIPSPGYVFSSWSGGVLGSDNPATFTMSFNMNVVANFVLFNIGALTNVELVSLSPQVVSISVGTYPVQGLGAMASGFTVERAYVVTPQGSGSFTLRFTGISAPHNVMAYKVGDTHWTLLPTTVAGDSAIDVTMNVVDPIIVLASAEPSGGPSITGRISALIGKISGHDGDVDTPVIVAIVIVGALVAGIVFVFVLLARQR
jgi:hypothetical protein